MIIRPSIVGYFAKHYLTASAIALLLIIGSAVAPFYSAPPAIIIVLFVAGIGIIVGAICHTLLYRQTTALNLSSEEVSYESGILSHQIVTAPIHMVTDSTITRSFFDKIIGAATIGINTSGSTAMEIMAEDFDYSEVQKFHDELYAKINSLPQSIEGKKVVP